MPKLDNGFLTNGLEYLIIEDNRINKSSFSLDVKVGTANESKEITGISHLIEHLIFKEPMNKFCNYLSSCGGIFNAKTGFEYTSYRFEIDHNYFIKALELFSYLIYKPSFEISDIKREKKIISSELESIYFDEANIQEYFFYKTSNLNSKLKRNHKNLNLKISKDQIKGYFNKYYKSKNIKLVIQSSIKSKLLIKHLEVCFSKIERGTCKSLVLKNNIGVKNFVVDINTQNIKLYFYLPSLHKFIKSKPNWIICSLINSNSKKGLIDYLKTKNLIIDIWSGIDLYSSFSILTIDIDLSDYGVENYKEVINVFFSYINFIKKNKIPKYIYEDQYYISNISKSNIGEGLELTSFYSRNMFNYIAKDIIKSTQTLSLISESKVYKIIKFVNMNNFTSILYSNIKGKCAKDKLYNIKYKKEFIYISNIENINFKYPSINKFIPKKLIYYKKDNIKYPHKILDNKSGYIWFMNDYNLKTSEAYINFDIVSPFVNKDPKSRILSTIFVFIVLEKLRVVSEKAQDAGLNFGFERIDRGFSVFIIGYSSKIFLLANKIIDALKIENFDLNKYFENTYSEIKKLFNKLEYISSYERSKYELYNKLHKYNIHRDLYKKIKVEKKDLLDFSAKVFSFINLEFYVYGNIDKAKLIFFYKCIFKKLNSKVLLNNISKDDINVPTNNKVLEIESFNKLKSVSMFIYFGNRTTKLSAIIQVGHIMFKAFLYNKIRASAGFGYLFETKVDFYETKLGISLSISSDEYNKKDLILKTDEILLEFCSYLESVSKVEFDKIKNVFVKKVLKTNLNLNDWMNEIVLCSVLNGNNNYASDLRCEVLKLSIDELIFSYKNSLDKNIRKSFTVVVD